MDYLGDSEDIWREEFPSEVPSGIGQTERWKDFETEALWLLALSAVCGQRGAPSLCPGKGLVLEGPNWAARTIIWLVGCGYPGPKATGVAQKVGTTQKVHNGRF